MSDLNALFSIALSRARALSLTQRRCALFGRSVSYTWCGAAESVHGADQLVCGEPSRPVAPWVDWSALCV